MNSPELQLFQVYNGISQLHKLWLVEQQQVYRLSKEISKLVQFLVRIPNASILLHQSSYIETKEHHISKRPNRYIYTLPKTKT